MTMWIPLAAVIAADNAFKNAPETPTPPDSSPSDCSGATLPIPDPEKVTTDDCNCKKGVSRE
jgi:hypothetical protein